MTTTTMARSCGGPVGLGGHAGLAQLLLSFSALLAVAGLSGCQRELSPSSVTSPPPAGREAVAPPVVLPSGAAAATGGQPMVADQSDRDPRSETVTVKILADPRRKARVLWGRKELGVAPLEIQRPRNSGPLDLLVLAPDCLPLHTRVFTDRDDKLWLRLYTKDEAPQVLGYRAEEVTPLTSTR